MDGKLSSGPRLQSDARLGAGLARGPNLRPKLAPLAWQQIWPAPGAVLDLDFANNAGLIRGYGTGGAMDGVTFSRSSTGRYFDANGLLAAASANVPRFDWASAARTGEGTTTSPYVIPLAAAPVCNGLLIEESRVNRLVWCRDATQSAWAKSNITAAKNQIGIDGVVNSASRLTASANGGTCIQSTTVASGARTGSVYLKRLTGTGDVQVSLDNATWATVELSSTEWRRIAFNATVTNPVVGIKLATSGDAVAMDYAQIEDGTFPTSPIETLIASASRSADLASLQGAAMAGLQIASGTFAVQGISLRRFGAQGTFLDLWQANTAMIVLGQASSGTDRLSLTYTGTTNVLYQGLAPFVSFKTAVSFGRGALGVSINGNPPSIASGADAFAGGHPYRIIPSRIYLGLDPNGATYANGCLSRVTLWPQTSNGGLLQGLTA